MQRLPATFILLSTLTILLPAASAAVPPGPMQCLPAGVSCVGNGSEPYWPTCPGPWADVLLIGYPIFVPVMYAQVCTTGGSTHLYVCPLARHWNSPNCESVHV